MAGLAQDKNHLFYPIETLLHDDNWGYLLSYAFQAPEKEELSFDSSNEADKRFEDGKSTTADSVEMLDNLLDIKGDVLLKLKRENHEKWERRVIELCAQMKKSIESFYSRKAASFLEIILSSDLGRDPSLLIGETNGTSPIVEEAVLVPWMFPTFPGTNPQVNWPERLPELSKRLNELKPLALWIEPFDESFEFQGAAYEFLERVFNEPQKDISQLALLTLLNVTLYSGSYDRIVLFSYNFLAAFDRFPNLKGVKH